MPDQWHYRLRGREYGPVPLRRLKELVEFGVVEPDSDVKTGRMPDWVPAESVPELAVALKPSAHLEQELVPDGEPERLTGPKPSASREPSIRADWHYVKNGQQQGPVTIEDLQRLAATGDLKENDEVRWQGSEFDWIAARNVPDLFSTPPLPMAAHPLPSTTELSSDPPAFSVVMTDKSASIAGIVQESRDRDGREAAKSLFSSNPALRQDREMKPAKTALPPVVASTIPSPTSAGQQETPRFSPDEKGNGPAQIKLPVAQIAPLALQPAQAEPTPPVAQFAHRQQQTAITPPDLVTPTDMAISGEQPRRPSTEKPQMIPMQDSEKRPTLKPCPDCGHIVSIRATSCPSCGAPQDVQVLPSLPCGTPIEQKTQRAKRTACDSVSGEVVRPEVGSEATALRMGINEWYIQTESGDAVGPFTLEQMKGKSDTGKIRSKTMVKMGQNSWMQADFFSSDFPGLLGPPSQTTYTWNLKVLGTKLEKFFDNDKNLKAIGGIVAVVIGIFVFAGWIWVQLHLQRSFHATFFSCNG